MILILIFAYPYIKEEGDEMGDINTNIRIDKLQKIVKAIGKRGSISTKVTTFYPESSGTAVDFTPEENTVLTVWNTHLSSPTQNYSGLTIGKLPVDNFTPQNFGFIGSNSGFTCFDGQITFYFSALGGISFLEVMVDSEE